MTRIVVDPVTRIEGHLRVEAILENGTIKDAISSGTMWRGIELILKGRDPREAWAFTQRICGVCTTVHALASVRCVENALGIQVPQNADLIRNIMFLTQMVQDHVVHFYHLHALDWVDVTSALKANASKTAALQRSISRSWPNSSPSYFRGVQAKLKAFVGSGQLGIFQNAYWGHPAYRLPAEGNLLAVAHYLEALQWQKEIVKIHAMFGGKNPHPNYLVGGMPSAFQTSGTSDDDGGGGILTATRLGELSALIQNAIKLVEGLYLPDLFLIASFYPEWAEIGSGLGNCLAYGDVPQNGVNDPSEFLFPRGVVLGRNLGAVEPLDLFAPDQIQEQVAHSWYSYPEGPSSPHPFMGSTVPTYEGPPPPYQYLDENGKYSWVKAPRWRGIPMEVGPLARVAVGYASGRQEFREVVSDALGKLGWPPDALFSTIGRTLARALETRLCVYWLKSEYDKLMANLSQGVLATADNTRWDPATWPTTARGAGFTEAPRGACAHWIQIDSNRKIANYQIVVPSTWNASPKDGQGQRGAYESALLGTPMANPEQPLEILRTIHSFDPCLACATHIMTPESVKLMEVQIG